MGDGAAVRQRVTDCCLGLGANLGNAHATLRRAAGALAALPRTRLCATSSVYRSAPVGPAGQGDYLNAAVRLATELDAEALLDHLQAIESAAGRVRTQRWGPRTLDLDLLLYGECTLATERLVVPHPRLTERNFVLQPLIDLLGEAHCVHGHGLGAWLAGAPANPLVKTEFTLRDCAAEPL